MMADPAPLPTIVVLASGSGTNLQALIDASRERDFPGEILAVGCNRPCACALERAAQANIKTFVVDHKKYGSREEVDGALMAELRRRNPDVIVLAGFMRILYRDFFFPAEDGIRDADVTGVQTCALPISTVGNLLELSLSRRELARHREGTRRQRQALERDYDLRGLVWADAASERVLSLACQVDRKSVV